MQNSITIKDDFSIEKIVDSGQFFRKKIIGDDIYRFVSGEHILYISKVAEHIYSISVSTSEWNDFWYNYFGLNTNYRAIQEKLSGENLIVDTAMEIGKGIRILRQDLWEVLITFIISQRRSIPSIMKCIDNLCVNFGTREKTPLEESVFLFPTPEQIYERRFSLDIIGAGYRTKYIIDAARKIYTREIALNELNNLNDNDLLAALKEFYGVGDKVANCIALFGYGRLNCVPVDVWISKTINKYFDGDISLINAFSPYSGIVQQYLFYYERNIIWNKK